MDNVKILDCTLRDGGYYNNWDFSSNFAKEYIKTLSKTSVNYIEIGFRKPVSNIGSGPTGLKKIGNFLNTKESLISKFNFPKNKIIGVMIDLSDYIGKDSLKNLKKNFKDSKSSKIKLVRIACNFEDKKNLAGVVRYLKNNNYKVGTNLMKFTILSNKQIYSFFKTAMVANTDYLYLADSFGNCLPQRINKISKYLKVRGIKLNKLGFHSHDNTGYALKNTISAIKNGFGMIDTSLMGMGRGAGNLKLEDFLKYKKRYVEKKKINIFTKNNMKNLHKRYNWGKNRFYNYSAKNNIHPTFVQRLLEEAKFKKNTTTKILQFLKKNNATQYDMNIFDNLFLKTQNFSQNKITTNKKIAIFCDNQIIKNINFKKLKLSGYLLSSLNFINFINNANLDLIFQCNAYRVFTEVSKIVKIKNIKLIIPNYILLKNFIKKNQNKVIKYNIFKNKNLSIEKNFCKFEKNLVLFYGLSFCISQKFEEIIIYGLTKNLSNLKIIKEVNNYLKKRKIKTSIILK